MPRRRRPKHSLHSCWVDILDSADTGSLNVCLVPRSACLCYGRKIWDDLDQKEARQVTVSRTDDSLSPFLGPDGMRRRRRPFVLFQSIRIYWSEESWDFLGTQINTNGVYEYVWNQCNGIETKKARWARSCSPPELSNYPAHTSWWPLALRRHNFVYLEFSSYSGYVSFGEGSCQCCRCNTFLTWTERFLDGCYHLGQLFADNPRLILHVDILSPNCSLKRNPLTKELYWVRLGLWPWIHHQHQVSTNKVTPKSLP